MSWRVECFCSLAFFSFLLIGETSVQKIERSRKLFKARISALFLFLFFISSSIFCKKNFIF